MLEKLLKDGWDCHDGESERLARDLEVAADAGVAPGLLAPFLHLSTHAIGEHLGDWPRALALGRRVLDGKRASAETARAWGRLYVAAVLAGDYLTAAEAELAYLMAAGEDFGAALLESRFMLANALVASKRVAEGARLYRGSLGMARQILPSSLLERAIAVASNNLGWELYEMGSRTPDETELMLLAGDVSLEFWRKCGDWINEERGLYLQAVIANATGDPKAGLTQADAALAIIDANGARPLDAATLHLARAQSLAALGDVEASKAAIANADAAAVKLASGDLRMKFAVERENTVDACSRVMALRS
jgi:hypothetical protein